MKQKVTYFFLGLIVLLFFKGIISSAWHPTETNLYVLQAEAFLHGKLAIDHGAHDAALFQGHYYVVFPPFPALFLTPFVALFGTTTNTVFISLGLMLASAFVLTRILQQLQLDRETIIWIAAGFFMGTAYWAAVKASGGIWFFAHIVCVCALLLAIYEALGQGRGWLVGIYFACAALSRHLTFFALPFLAYAVWTKQHRKADVLWIFISALATALIYLWMNWMRFDNPFDTGYNYILQTGFLKERLDTYGLFNIHYFPFNFIYLFLQGFHIEFDGNSLLHMHCLDPFGTSLTFASPFLFTAFWAHWKRGLLITAWTSIFLIALCTLFYYNNGFYQINAQRFTLDFLPLLIPLTALGTKQCKPFIWKTLILYSIMLNLIASLACTLS